MISVNQSNKILYEEKTSYFVRYSCLWISIQILQFITSLSTTLVNKQLRESHFSLYIIASLIQTGWVLVLLRVLCQPFPLYNKRICRQNFDEYRRVTKCLLCYYFYYLGVLIFALFIVAVILKLTLNAENGGKLVGTSKDKITRTRLLWGGFSIYCVFSTIPVGFNIWMICLYRNYIKPLVEYFDSAEEEVSQYIKSEVGFE